MNKRKGISLIVLVITILVMIILAGVVVVSLSKNNPIEKAKEANFKTDVSSFASELGVGLSNSLVENSSVKPEEIFANKFVDMKKYINSFSKKYENKLVIADGKLTYIGGDSKEEKWSEECGIEVFRGVNKPVLSEGMIPIKYENNSWVICSENDPSWYNYGQKLWANVMLLDGKYKDKNAIGTRVTDGDLGSMFVWIPRYAYSINKYKTPVTGTEGQTQEIHNISFLLGTSNSDIKGNTYGKSYDAKNAEVGKPTPKIVHPAFNFGGVEKQGIWVAKFEASMKAENNVKVIPGVSTWREISVGEAMTKCMEIVSNINVYGITNGADSHLMRNSDWGTVTILTTSKYGSTPTINSENKNLGNSKYEVYAGGSGNNYKLNTSQSTTGNITGIYDMNGGAWEYVAAYFDNKSYTLQQYAPKFFNGSVVKSIYAKYFDIYTASSKELNTEEHSKIWDAAYGEAPYTNAYKKEIAKERYNNLAKYNGQAFYECIQDGDYSYFGRTTGNHMTWLINIDSEKAEYGKSIYNNDFSLIGHTNFSFVLRGGFWGDASNAGIFASYNLLGGAAYDLGFRPVIVND